MRDLIDILAIHGMEMCPQISRHLDRVGSLVDERLRREDDPTYGLAGSFLRRKGKRIRPALCLLSCGAAGGDYDAVVESAAIIEIVHNVTLIHDDVEDGSDFRRGEPTLHSAHGIPTALNSADALYNLAWDWMLGLSLPAERILILQKMYADYAKRMVRGQGREISWIRDTRFDVSEEEYMAMAKDKTGALMELACDNGIFFTHTDRNTREMLRAYGWKVGVAFQIRDDMLNISGDFGKYRKEIGGDIREGKRTLMTIHCLQEGGAGGSSRLREILAAQEKREEEVAEAIGILRDSGSLDYAGAAASKLAEDAVAAIDGLMDSEDKESLIRIAGYSVTRES